MIAAHTLKGSLGSLAPDGPRPAEQLEQRAARQYGRRG